jgi:GT2 family glycosyltransferase
MAGVSVIIPTWNRSELLATALECLSKQTLQPDQIIVVDNGSTDDTPAIVERFGAQLIRFPVNRGFAPAVNAGIENAIGDWILILNNDVELPPDWLASLHAAAEADDAAFAVGKLVCRDQPDTLDGSWDLLSRGGHAWRCGFGRKDGAHWATRRPIDFAPMTAALFHKRVFAQIGLLDQRFEAYYEDVDFGLRCALAGLQGIYEPAATATHRSKGTLGQNSARVLFLTARNQLFLLARNFPKHTLRRWWWPILTAQFLSLLGAAQNGHLLSGIQGVWEGLRRWKEIRKHPANHAALEAVLTRSEREISQLQRHLGFDPYWRLYFSLVRSG